MTNYEPLTDMQWQELAPLFPNPVKRTRGKPHTPWRSVVNSIFYVLFMGLKWGSLPKEPAFATKSAAHRWFVLWEKSGFLKQLVDTYQTVANMGSGVKLPRRRNRLPAAKRVLETAVAAG
jgi:transposase